MIRFVLLGLLTAAVGERQFSVFLRHDLENFAGSPAFNALYLTGVYVVTRPFFAALSRHPRGVALYAVVFGCAGLLVAWFLIGNSPWGNPQASQIEVFAYWSCMALVPLVCSFEPDAVKRSAQTFVVRRGVTG